MRAINSGSEIRPCLTALSSCATSRFLVLPLPAAAALKSAAAFLELILLPSTLTSASALSMAQALLYQRFILRLAHSLAFNLGLGLECFRRGRGGAGFGGRVARLLRGLFLGCRVRGVLDLDQ